MIETSRLQLIPIESAHAGFLFELLNSAAFIKNIGDRNVRTLADAEGYVVKVQDTCKKFGFSPYVVVEKQSGETIGICNLVKRDYLDQPDIGFAFLEKAWGRGYAAEAAKSVLENEKRKLGLTRVLGITSPGNLGSIRVLEKLGLKFERMVKPNEKEELKLFSLDF